MTHCTAWIPGEGWRAGAWYESAEWVRHEAAGAGQWCERGAGGTSILSRHGLTFRHGRELTKVSPAQEVEYQLDQFRYLEDLVDGWGGNTGYRRVVGGKDFQSR